MRCSPAFPNLRVQFNKVQWLRIEVTNSYKMRYPSVRRRQIAHER